MSVSDCPAACFCRRLCCWCPCCCHCCCIDWQQQRFICLACGVAVAVVPHSDKQTWCRPCTCAATSSCGASASAHICVCCLWCIGLVCVRENGALHSAPGRSTFPLPRDVHGDPGAYAHLTASLRTTVLCGLCAIAMVARHSLAWLRNVRLRHTLHGMHE